MSRSPAFARREIELFERAKIVGVRSGTEHRYTGVWGVVVDGRVYVRSWSDRPTGWYRAFLEQPSGSVQVEERELDIRAEPVRSATVRDRVTAAFAAKYRTKGSQRWVTGFAEPGRAANTLELQPRDAKHA